MKDMKTVKNGRKLPSHPASREEGRGSNDLLLKSGAVVLAGAAVVFPWYVFLHQDQFGVSVAGWEQLRDAHGFRQRDLVEVPPMSIARRAPEESETTDKLTTATVARAGDIGEGRDDGALEQPFPGRSGFRLLHVANGRAMIEDAAGMYIVQIGSILPDNSKLAALTQKNGKWVIVTSTGQFYESQQ